MQVGARGWFLKAKQPKIICMTKFEMRKNFLLQGIQKKEDNVPCISYLHLMHLHHQV